ncbi:GATOR1 complex protein NPRL3 [Parasteatoda tepidariorum]|uniref:GATOR1 complex protein NPRL3 n=1 Tax=Parasteatoda tepidariorum TaxID=114398 RepID=UPI00077FC72A|nr:GATOR complex protein NPRL3 [Parasteatoda tepidariorum]XP_015920361.1 GATOR complex protein NPRL3 [Parasteatoda tepidariorum]XP_042907083.1 GATOR complex protein NPRL3 [Parasteatoda tepidariorum]
MVDETVPIGLFLVTSGSKGDRLLFRYPFIFDVNRENGVKGSKKSPYAILSDHKDDLRISQEEGLDPKECNLSGFDDKLLSTLLKPGPCGQKLELKIENVRFIGHPTRLPHDPYRELSTITMFNVVFALRADASYSVVSCYHDLSHRLAVAIRHEESRCNYLTSQVKLMQSAHDEIASLPEDNEESPFQLILSRSELAVQLKMAFVDLKTNGMVRLKINGWIELSFCLPNTLEEERLLIEPACIQACLKNLRPYHGLLLLTGATELLSSLPEDSSPALIRLISVTSPLKNFQQLAADADIILTHVFQLVSHLLYWGKATIIYPICESNFYVISPHAPTEIHSPLVPKFNERFPNCSLLKILSKFSLPISLSGLHNPINSPYQQAQQVQMVIWMLQHRLLIQLHTYVYLIPSERSPACSNIHSFDLSYSDQSDESHSKASSEDEDLSLREQDSIRQANLKPTERDILRDSSSSSNSKEDLKNFLRFCRYFRGQHHLEEIMYCENIRRSHLHSLLDKFRKILITCQFEDAAVCALNNRI